MRKENWASLLNEHLKEHLYTPFKRGEQDCALFVADCINLIRLSDEDIAASFRERYKTLKGAKELLRAEGFNHLDDVADHYLTRLPSVNYAKRGDCVTLPCKEGICLGIVDGTGIRAVTTGKDGLVFYEKKQWLNAWEV